MDPAIVSIFRAKRTGSFCCCWAATSQVRQRTSQRREFLWKTTEGEGIMDKKASYQKDLIESLRDPCEAAAYLNAAIEEGDRAVFLLALRNVAEAHGGMA